MAWVNREVRRGIGPNFEVALFAAEGWEIDFDPPNENEPTEAMPGSEMKLRVLRRRMELGQELWNEADVVLRASGCERVCHGRTIGEVCHVGFVTASRGEDSDR